MGEVIKERVDNNGLPAGGTGGAGGVGGTGGAGRFIRKGEVGNWKEYFDEELLDEFVQWEQKELNGNELEFEFEL